MARRPVPGRERRLRRGAATAGRGRAVAPAIVTLVDDEVGSEGNVPTATNIDRATRLAAAPKRGWSYA